MYDMLVTIDGNHLNEELLSATGGKATLPKHLLAEHFAMVEPMHEPEFGREIDHRLGMEIDLSQRIEGLNASFVPIPEQVLSAASSCFDIVKVNSIREGTAALLAHQFSGRA